MHIFTRRRFSKFLTGVLMSLMATISQSQTQTQVQSPDVLVPGPSFIYRDSGHLVRISGVVDASDYLRLTQSVQQLPSVDYIYVAALSATNLVLVVGTQRDAYSLDSLLSQQSWLSSSGSGSFRWNAMGAPVPTGVAAQQNRAE